MVRWQLFYLFPSLEKVFLYQLSVALHKFKYFSSRHKKVLKNKKIRKVKKKDKYSETYFSDKHPDFYL